MKFLIVDDSRAMQHMVIKTLHQAGYQGHLFQVAPNGQEALEMVEKWEPDLILSDWHMPIMDGITLLRTLKSQGSTVKFGFVTTERSKARVTEAIEAGAMFVVSKPFSPAQISEAVVEAIAVKAEPEEAGHQEHDYIDLPDIDAITHVLEDVLPGTPFVTDCPKTSTVIYPYMLGLYQNQNSQIKAAVIIDNILSCLLGAAFADVPVDTAYDSIGEKLITMELHDNVIELFGFLNALFYDTAKHEELMYRNSLVVNGYSDKLEAAFSGPKAVRKDYLVDINGYGCGKLTLISL